MRRGASQGEAADKMPPGDALMGPRSGVRARSHGMRRLIRMAHAFFISCAHEDRSFGDAVRAKLEQSGARCRIAPRDIPPGQDYA